MKLNKFVVREVHPMAIVESSLDMLGRAQVFSKNGANIDFWQIPLKKESTLLPHYVSTHRRRYQYLRLPNGLCSAPEIFQSEMSHVFVGIIGVIFHVDGVPCVKLIVRSMMWDWHWF